MNPDSPQLSREELEVRLTALLLGELPAAEAGAMMQLVSQDADLAKLLARLEQTIGLVRAATTAPASDALTPPNQPKLSGARREKLLQHLKLPTPAQLGVPPLAPRKPRVRWLVCAGVASVLFLLLAAALLPALSAAKSKRKSSRELTRLSAANNVRITGPEAPRIRELRPSLVPTPDSHGVTEIAGQPSPPPSDAKALRLLESKSEAEALSRLQRSAVENTRALAQNKIYLPEAITMSSGAEQLNWGDATPPATRAGTWGGGGYGGGGGFGGGGMGGFGGGGGSLGGGGHDGVRADGVNRQYPASGTTPQAYFSLDPERRVQVLSEGLSTGAAAGRAASGLSVLGADRNEAIAGKEVAEVTRQSALAEESLAKRTITDAETPAFAAPVSPSSGMSAEQRGAFERRYGIPLPQAPGASPPSAMRKPGVIDGRLPQDSPLRQAPGASPVPPASTAAAESRDRDLQRSGINAQTAQERAGEAGGLGVGKSFEKGQALAESLDVQAGALPDRAPGTTGFAPAQQQAARSAVRGRISPSSAPADTESLGRAVDKKQLADSFGLAPAAGGAGGVSDLKQGVEAGPGVGAVSSPPARSNKQSSAMLAQDGRLLWEMGKIDEAEVKLRKAITLDPDNKAAFYYQNLVEETRFGRATQEKELNVKKGLVMVEDAWGGPVKRDMLPQPNPYATTNLVHTGLGRQAIISKHYGGSDSFGAYSNNAGATAGSPALDEVIGRLETAEKARQLDRLSVSESLHFAPSTNIANWGDFGSDRSLNLGNAKTDWFFDNNGDVAKGKERLSELATESRERLPSSGGGKDADKLGRVASSSRGALYLPSTENQSAGVPLLGDIPVIGQQFRSENKRSTQSNGASPLPAKPAQTAAGAQVADAKVKSDASRVYFANRKLDESQRLGEKPEVAQVEAESLPPAKPAPGTPIPQPEVQAAENPFSTFSLNVSDVSFKLAAASLEKGVMPEPASVRSEEFINAFDYRDPEAPPGVPVAFAWERARYPFAHNRDLLRFSIKTAAQGRQAGRPLNLVLLLDNSGSMERADRVSIIREALQVLAAQLQPQDKISVVAFARTARLWIDGLPGSQAGELVERVGNLTPQGGTNLEDAMNLAYQTALRHYLANGINRVVLLTDGAANLGDVDPDSLKKNVEAHRKQGIALDCFGIGWEGYNDDLLEVLSRNGDGRYGFVNTPEAVATEFAAQLAGALQVAASDVKVQVEFNPARVNAYRQIGYAKHQLTKEQFRDNTVDAAEIAAAEAGNALYVIETNPQGQGPLATVRVRYKVPGTSDYRELEWPVPYTGAAVALEQSSPAMRLATTAAAFSEWLVSSPFAGEVTPDQLLATLSGVPEVYGADARPKKLEWMIRQAKAIAGK